MQKIFNKLNPRVAVQKLQLNKKLAIIIDKDPIYNMKGDVLVSFLFL